MKLFLSLLSFLHGLEFCFVESMILFFSIQNFADFSFHFFTYVCFSLLKNPTAVVFLGFLEGVKLAVCIQAAAVTQMFLIVL